MLPAEPFTLQFVESTTHCRICLEPCHEEEYCSCRGDLIVHSACLLEFLKRRPNGPNFDRCEICN